MYRIRIKGKYIVLLVLLFVVFSFTMYRATVQAFAHRELERLEEMDVGQLAEYVDLLEKRYGNEAAMELYFSAERDAGGSMDSPGNMVYIFPRSTWQTGLIPAQDGAMELAVAKLKLVRERYPDSPWAQHALQKLGRAYYNLGDEVQAEEYLLTSIKESNWNAAGSTQLLAEMYLERGDNLLALNLVAESLREEPGQLALDLLLIKGRALMALGEWERAREVFTSLPVKAADIFSIDPNDSKEDFSGGGMIQHWGDIARVNLRWLDGLQQGSVTGTITGRVTLGNEGLVGARVFLYDITEEKNYFSTAEIAEMKQVVSGADGSYYFADIVPGRYEVGVAVQIPKIQGYMLPQVKDITVLDGETYVRDVRFVPTAAVAEPVGGKELNGMATFRWEPVDGADYYHLVIAPVGRNEDGKISTSYSIALRTDIKEHQITLDLEQEIAKARFQPSFGHSNGNLNPRSVFGLLYYGGEFIWSVNAFNAEGAKISDSNGYGTLITEEQMPLFSVKGTLSEADRLLLAQQYEDAIRAYQHSVNEDPNDTHALLMLARMHQFGIRVHEPDFPTAARYYEMFLEVEDAPEARKALAYVYYRNGQDTKAYQMYNKLLATSDEDWQTHFYLAKIEYSLGSPEDALVRLDRAVQMENGIYARAYPVALSLVLGEPEKAASFAGNVDEGDRYLELLSQYQAAGYTPDEDFIAALRQGDYSGARALLTTVEHDIFLRALLVFLEARSRPYEEVEKIRSDMKPGLLNELLKKMI